VILLPSGFSQKVSHPGTNQAQPCLASVGNQSWVQGDIAAGNFIGNSMGINI